MRVRLPWARLPWAQGTCMSPVQGLNKKLATAQHRPVCAGRGVASSVCREGVASIRALVVPAGPSGCPRPHARSCPELGSGTRVCVPSRCPRCLCGQVPERRLWSTSGSCALPASRGRRGTRPGKCQAPGTAGGAAAGAGPVSGLGVLKGVPWLGQGQGHTSGAWHVTTWTQQRWQQRGRGGPNCIPSGLAQAHPGGSPGPLVQLGTPRGGGAARLHVERWC